MTRLQIHKGMVMICLCTILSFSFGCTNQKAQTNLTISETEHTTIVHQEWIDSYTEIYNHPETYLQKELTLSGKFSVAYDNTNHSYLYSLYEENLEGTKFGLEIDSADFTGLRQNNIISVTGILDSYSINETEYLVLHVKHWEKNN